MNKRIKKLTAHPVLIGALALIAIGLGLMANGKYSAAQQPLLMDEPEVVEATEEAPTAASEWNDEGLELPKGGNPSSETIRERVSYTVSYNHEYKQPNWVAWKLTPAHAAAEDVDRESFEDDDEMPGPKGTKADYYNSGYDRGHLCPAGDNKWSTAAMKACCLMTNICPQNHELNSGRWNAIEKDCRSWAERHGTLYIATGPIYLNQEHKHIGKGKVTVPEAFFKVILCLEGTPKAIGFICRNQSQKGRKQAEFVNTIDEVERITGYDFFSLLPDHIENAVEARASLDDWE